MFGCMCTPVEPSSNLDTKHTRHSKNILTLLAVPSPPPHLPEVRGPWDALSCVRTVGAVPSHPLGGCEIGSLGL